MGRLDGKVALISGGARGQGAVEARMFASEGACVVFGDILDDEGRRVRPRSGSWAGKLPTYTWTLPAKTIGRMPSPRQFRSTASSTCW